MLSEERRKQLDGIVQQMVTNKESDSNIQFVVDDFKKKYENETTQTQQTQPQKSFVQKASELVPNLAVGAAKALGSTAAGAASLGEKILRAPLKALGMNTPEQTGSEQLGLQEKLKPTNTAQKIGFGAEQIAEFFAPAGIIGKAGKVAEGASKIA